MYVGLNPPEQGQREKPGSRRSSSPEDSSLPHGCQHGPRGSPDLLELNQAFSEGRNPWTYVRRRGHTGGGGKKKMVLISARIFSTGDCSSAPFVILPLLPLPPLVPPTPPHPCPPPFFFNFFFFLARCSARGASRVPACHVRGGGGSPPSSSHCNKSIFAISAARVY